MATHAARARRRLRSPSSFTRAPGPTRRRPGLGDRVRYAFDSSLSRGPIALIGWLALLSLVVVVTGAAVIVLLDLAPTDGGPLSAPEAAWQSMMRALDAGGVGADVGWPFRAIMLLVTIGGLFIVSTLIGVLTAGIEGQLEQLRKGRSAVLESGHTVVLGWSPKIMTVLTELAVANANTPRPRVVVLADRDKVEMEDEIRNQVGDRLGSTKVICRSGSPLSVVDLQIANIEEARSVILLAPEDDTTDRFVLRALLALTDPSVRTPGRNHVVATLVEPASAEVADIIAGDDVRVLGVGDLIARITAQTCRQSGLSVVYAELLDFDGAEIYFHPEPRLDGRTYADAQLAYETSTVMGLRRADGTILLNPPAATVLAADDHVIAISEDDDTVRLAVDPVAPPVPADVRDAPEAPPAPEHTLVLGWNARGGVVLRQLDAYVSPGSTVDVVAAHPGLGEDLAEVTGALAHTAVVATEAAITRRAVLESLALERYDHIILLAEEAAESRDEADTDTLVTLLHLRDLAARRGLAVGVVTEVLDSRNRELLTTTSADDFIVSDQLISLLLAQVSENAELATVFTALFDPEGSEIYLRPADAYVVPGRATPFSTVVASASGRGETAIGYRLAALAGDATAQHGVVVNPPKSAPVTLGPEDRVIVLAEG
ncbi:potassium transporter TrkA [Euzebya sp.]|uniref:CASTOR/POLLUX-related putative ion channel n=1 Tax=Euzebya sp. TaxID=1971409 RepID=UPI003517E5B8